MTINQQITQGIVLKTIPYKEHDALLHVFTKEFGKVTMLAKGVAKMKSKNRPACQSLTFSEFTFIPRKGICSLIKATPCNYYSTIKKDITLEAYASFIMEYFYVTAKDNDPNNDEYTVLHAGLNLLNEHKQGWLVYVMCIVELLRLNGSSLYIDGCSNCNHQNVYGISIKSGGYVCSNCFSKYDQSYTNFLLKYFRIVNKSGFKHIDKVEIEDKYERDLVLLFEAYYDEFIGTYLKSKNFIHQLRQYR